MPEIPQIKFLVERYLKPRLKEAKVEDIRFLSGKYKNNNPPDGIQNAKGKKITSVNQHGKFIYFRLSNRHFIWATLGLSGTFTERESPIPPNKNYRVLFVYTSKGMHQHSPHYLFFRDFKGYGTIHYKTTQETRDKLNSLGIDILKGSVLSIMNRLKSKNFRKDKYITEILLDQSIASGIGNYLKSEALYKAEVSPHRKLSNLGSSNIRDIFKQAKKIAQLHYKILTNNQDISNHMAVYNQEVDPDGRPVKKEITEDSRRTYWVPSIQR